MPVSKTIFRDNTHSSYLFSPVMNIHANPYIDLCVIDYRLRYLVLGVYENGGCTYSIYVYCI